MKSAIHHTLLHGTESRAARKGQHTTGATQLRHCRSNNDMSHRTGHTTLTAVPNICLQRTTIHSGSFLRGLAVAAETWR